MGDGMTWPIARPALRARILDSRGYVVGVVANPKEVRASPRLSAGGTWSITMPAVAPEAALWTEGSGVLIEQHVGDGAYRSVMSGPATVLDEGATVDDPGGTLTVTGTDDLSLLADYVTLPDPTRAPTAQTTAVQWGDLASVGNGEVDKVLRDCVRQQLLDTTADRRIERFEQGPDIVGTTPTVSLRSRYEPLLEFVQRAAAPYGLAVRIRPEVRRVSSRAQVWRIFQTYAPADLSATIAFSAARGNLLGYQWKRTTPAYTHPIIGGANEGTARLIASGALTAESDLWARRIEEFLDRTDADDAPKLTSRLIEALAEAYLAAAPGLAVTPLDTPEQTFGVHYDLGDIVTVTVRDVQIVERIRAVDLLYTAAAGLTIAPLIGPEGTLHPRLPLTPRLLAITRAGLARATRK